MLIWETVLDTVTYIIMMDLVLLLGQTVLVHVLCLHVLIVCLNVEYLFPMAFTSQVNSEHMLVKPVVATPPLNHHSIR